MINKIKEKVFIRKKIKIILQLIITTTRKRSNLSYFDNYCDLFILFRFNYFFL